MWSSNCNSSTMTMHSWTGQTWAQRPAADAVVVVHVVQAVCWSGRSTRRGSRTQQRAASWCTGRSGPPVAACRCGEALEPARCATGRSGPISKWRGTAGTASAFAGISFHFGSSGPRVGPFDAFASFDVAKVALDRVVGLAGRRRACWGHPLLIKVGSRRLRCSITSGIDRRHGAEHALVGQVVLVHPEAGEAGVARYDRHPPPVRLALDPLQQASGVRRETTI